MYVGRYLSISIYIYIYICIHIQTDRQTDNRLDIYIYIHIYINIPPTSGRRVMSGGHELRICCVQTGSGVTERMGLALCQHGSGRV